MTHGKVCAMQSQLHPIFASILAMHGMPQDADALPIRRAAYVSDLTRMDWQFEHSEDQRVWRAGRDELTRLRAERAAVDPDGALWRKHAHRDYPA
jgi:hypothetical protein